VEGQYPFSAYVTWVGLDHDAIAVLGLGDMAPEPINHLWRASRRAIREHFNRRRLLLPAAVDDGLVSQIPALPLSTATGIIVTRSATEGELGRRTPPGPQAADRFLARRTCP